MVCQSLVLVKGRVAEGPSDPAGPRQAAGSSEALAGCSHPQASFALVRWLHLTFPNRLALEIWFSDFIITKFKYQFLKVNKIILFDHASYVVHLCRGYGRTGARKSLHLWHQCILVLKVMMPKAALGEEGAVG